MVYLSGILVALFASFLLGLAISTVFSPRLAKQFLQLFASTRRAHFIEQGLRLVVGLALVDFSPKMSFSFIFNVFGWVIAVTAIGLILTPWRWHHWFAGIVIPPVISHLRWFGLGAFLLAAFVIYGMFPILSNW